jgi:hypothetical protein
VEPWERSADMGSDDLTCRELAELVTDYLEEALSLPDRRRFEQHVRSCRVCPVYLEQMRLTIRTLGRLTEDDVPTSALAPLLGAFRRWKCAY